jgi:pre-mRNA-splicing factor ATP-dependent RNA helicase DHX15/PRP43
MQSMSMPLPEYDYALMHHVFFADLNDRNWAWNNYLSQRALAQADNVRNQIKRVMEKQDIDLVSTSDQRNFYLNVRKALVCGFFMQVAHREGEKGNYLTVKDNQVWAYTALARKSNVLTLNTFMLKVVALHPSCGLNTTPEWVIFNEFVLTTRPYIRTVTEVYPEWLVLTPPFLWRSVLIIFHLQASRIGA